MVQAMAKFFADRFSYFARASTAHYPGTGAVVANNVPRYKNGGVLIEEGANFVPSNPFFIDGVTDWSLFQNAGANAAKSQKSDAACYGGKYCEIAVTTGLASYTDVHLYKLLGAATAGQKVPVLVRIKASQAITRSVSIIRHDSPYTPYKAQNINITTEYQDFVIVATVTEAVNVRVAVNVGGGNNITYSVDVVCGLFGADYMLSPGIGTKAQDVYYLSGGFLNPDEWALDMTIEVNAALKSTQQARYLFGTAVTAGSNMAYLSHTTGGAWEFGLIDATGYATVLSVTDNLAQGKHVFRCKATKAEAALLIDGQKVASVANPKLPSAYGDRLYFGCHYNETGPISTVIYDARISTNRPDGDALNDYTNGYLMADDLTIIRLPFEQKLEAEIPIPKIIPPIEPEYEDMITETTTGKYIFMTAFGTEKRRWSLNTGHIRKAQLYGLEKLFAALYYGTIAEYFWLFDFGPESNRVKAYLKKPREKISSFGTVFGWDERGRENVELKIIEQ